MVAVEHELRSTPPHGMTELELIRAMQKEPWQLLGPVNFHQPDQLYPVHFLLFHVLYRLRDQLAGTGVTISISPLKLCLEPVTRITSEGLPEAEDKLRAFYLDLDQYALPESEIHRMMDDFWAGQARARPNQPEVVKAASVLGFSSLPESFSEIKQRFRQRVMKAHPDRGGDTETVQCLNEAFSVLKAHYA